jgi:hypothetical protein
MIQLTEKQVRTLKDSAIIYKDAIRKSPSISGQGDYGTLIVDERDKEVIQLIELGLAIEEKYDAELAAAVKDLQDKKQVTLRVLNLTREAVLLFMDSDKRGIN